MTNDPRPHPVEGFDPLLDEDVLDFAEVASDEMESHDPTGLAELDVLVDHLNAAARDMEDRQDTILGRIAVVQEMARMVAHEVRNPLQSIELLTSLIASEQDERERLELANAIHEEIRTLETVVTRLLRESATKGALRLRHQSASVVSLIEQVVALRRPQAQAQAYRRLHSRGHGSGARQRRAICPAPRGATARRHSPRTLPPVGPSSSWAAAPTVPWAAWRLWSLIA